MIDSIERKSDRSDICRAGRGNGCWSELCPSHTCPTNPFCSHAGYRRPLSDTRLWDYDPGDRDTRRQTIEHDECVSPSFLGHSITLEPPSCPSRSVAERNLRFASAAERHYQCLRAPIHTQRCEHVSMWKDSVRSASSLTVAIFKYLIRLACLFTFMKGVNQNP